MVELQSLHHVDACHHWTNVKGISIRSLYYYRHQARADILKAKIQGSKRTISQLMDAFLGHNQWVYDSLFETATEVTIVTAPSSLKGRLLGQIDLAYLMSRQILKHYPTFEHQRLKSWTLGKRAFKSKEKKYGKPTTVSAADWTEKKVYCLIDDLVTTGKTMQKMRTCTQVPVNQASVFLGFSLACSPRRDAGP